MAVKFYPLPKNTYLFKTVIFNAIYSLLFVIISTMQIDLHAQGLSDKVYGGTLDDFGKIIIPAHDGGYLLGGSSKSNIGPEKTAPHKNGLDYWIVKIDTNGVRQWDKSFSGSAGSGTGDDVLNALIATSDGGYLLGGTSISEVGLDKSDTHDGMEDFWVIKIDVAGNKIWDKNLGSSNDERLISMVETSDGGYLLAGSSNENTEGMLHDKTEAGRGLSDYWVVKIDVLGNKQWDKLYGGEYDDKFGEIVKSNDGNYLLAGSSGSDKGFEKSSNSKSLQDYWILKIDPLGNKIWDKTIGGDNFDDLKAALALNDGGFVIGGSSYADAGKDKSENSRGVDDFWVVKVDANGNIKWDKTYGSTDKDVLRDILLTPNNHLMLIGLSNSPAGFEKSENSSGGNDFWVVHADLFGNKKFDFTIGGISGDVAESAVVHTEDSLLVFGYSASPILQDQKSEAPIGETDYWLVNMEIPKIFNHEIKIKDWILVCKFCDIWQLPWKEIIDIEYRFWSTDFGVEKAYYRLAYEGKHRDRVYWQNDTDLIIEFEKDLPAGEYQFQMRGILQDGSKSEWTKAVPFEVNRRLVEVFPNPIKENFNILYEGRNREILQIAVSNIFGKVIYREDVKVEAGMNELNISVPPSRDKLLVLQLLSNMQEPFIRQLARE